MRARLEGLAVSVITLAVTIIALTVTVIVLRLAFWMLFEQTPPTW